MEYCAKTDRRVFDWLVGEAMLDPELGRQLLAREGRYRVVRDLPLSSRVADAMVSVPDEFEELSELAEYLYSRYFILQ
jgi:hypothetical protein